MLRLFPWPRAEARDALLERVFERFTRLETGNARRSNLDRRARLGVTPFPCRPLFHSEGTEANQRDLLRGLQAFRNGIEHTIDGARRSRLRDVSRFRDLFNQFSFIHISPLRLVLNRRILFSFLSADRALYRRL